MRRKLIQDIRTIFQALFFLLSPLMIIGCVVGVLALVTRHGEHQQMVRRMTEHGLETKATVDFPSPDHDWVHVTYVDAEGSERFGVLDMAYYAGDAWRVMKSGAVLRIRHLPFDIPGSDRVVLASRFAEVRSYRGYLSTDLLILVGICWLVVALEPRWLYVGMVDKDTLFEGQFT